MIPTYQVVDSKSKLFMLWTIYVPACASLGFVGLQHNEVTILAAFSFLFLFLLSSPCPNLSSFLLFFFLNVLLVPRNYGCLI